MNASQKLVVWVEGLLFVILALLIESIFPETITSYNITVAISLTLLVFYSYRRGSIAGYIAGAVLGAVVGYLQVENVQTEWMVLVASAIQAAMVGLSGKFARNLQRTLFNRRMSSVYLNLITGTSMTFAAFFILKFIFNQYVLNVGQVADGTYAMSMLWSFLANLALALIILVIILNVSSKYWIPKNTPYISRKERSRLLND
ncbi:energy-coupled thiamine transporter ThiT [Aerococcus sp. NPDC058936]|uniref:energy-coupled thiamine transporter ThiT n=1 Tax=Aerococcus sp. NPDC058936 TaxID=3346674 RepID=UPI00366EDB07